MIAVICEKYVYIFPLYNEYVIAYLARNCSSLQAGYYYEIVNNQNNTNYYIYMLN